MQENQVLYLSQDDIGDVDVTKPEAIETLDLAFWERREARVEMPWMIWLFFRCSMKER